MPRYLCSAPAVSFAVAPLLCALHACGSSAGRSERADTGASAAAVASVPPVASSTRSKKISECPPTGSWALCSVEKRLKQSGFVPRKVAAAGERRPGFTVVPTTYVLGHSTLEVFLYPSAAALGRDWAKLDTIRGAPRGQVGAWTTAPTLLRSANLAAVFLTESPREAERLTLALTAGAPQPATRSMNTVVLPAVEIHR